jgi:hypothetical protein
MLLTGGTASKVVLNHNFELLLLTQIFCRGRGHLVLVTGPRFHNRPGILLTRGVSSRRFSDGSKT